MFQILNRRLVIALLMLGGCEALPEDTTEPTDAPDRGDDPDFLAGLSALGRGYDVFGDYANPLEVTRPVLDYDALWDAGLVDVFTTSTSTFEVFEGSSLQEYSRQMSTRASVSGSSGPFSGAVESNFALGAQGRMEYSFATLQFLDLKRHVQILETRAEGLHEFVTPVAQRDIDDPSFPAGDLLDEYGTHVLLDVFLGGRLDYNMAVDMSDVSSTLSLGVAVQASYKGVVNSASLEV